LLFIDVITDTADSKSQETLSFVTRRKSSI